MRPAEIEALWETYVYPFRPKARSASRQARGIAAWQVLQRLETIASQANAEDERLKAISHAHSVWALLIIEMGTWFSEPPTGIDYDDAPERKRTQLRHLILWQRAGIIPPSLVGGLDPVAVILPRALLDALADALGALDQGEVLPLVAPKVTGRHRGDPWTLDQAHARALEHVAFLWGQDVAKDKARERVAKAMLGLPQGEATPGSARANATDALVATIKSWEKKASKLRASVPDLDWRLENAREAGRIAAAEQDGNEVDPVDAHAWAAQKALQAEDLARFGRRYHETFGDRHGKRIRQRKKAVKPAAIYRTK